MKNLREAVENDKTIGKEIFKFYQTKRDINRRLKFDHFERTSLESQTIKIKCAPSSRITYPNLM